MIRLLTENLNRIRTITFRNVIKEDIPQVIVQLKAFSVFCGGKVPLYPENEEYAQKLIHKLIDEHVFYGAFNGDKLVGFIGGTISGHLMNPELRVLNEVFFWVVPEYRKSKAAKVLLEAFIDYGKKNCDWILFGVIDKSTMSVRTLEKRGFVLKEKSYLLEV